MQTQAQAQAQAQAVDLSRVLPGPVTTSPALPDVWESVAGTQGGLAALVKPWSALVSRTEAGAKTASSTEWLVPLAREILTAAAMALVKAGRVKDLEGLRDLTSLRAYAVSQWNLWAAAEHAQAHPTDVEKTVLPRMRATAGVGDEWARLTVRWAVGKATASRAAQAALSLSLHKIFAAAMAAAPAPAPTQTEGAAS
jgi:hypothetical protein